jgi:hypothetical protein
LWLIDSNPGVAQISVATALGMDRATMVEVVDRVHRALRPKQPVAEQSGGSTKPV